MTLTAISPETRGAKRHLVVHEHLLERRFVGPVDHLSAEGVLALLPQLPTWPATLGDRNSRIRGATTILSWLLTSPGKGWQERWVAVGADNDLSWIDTLAPSDGRSARTQRQEHISGLACLLMCRVVLPSYDFLSCYQSTACSIGYGRSCALTCSLSSSRLRSSVGSVDVTVAMRCA